MMAKGKGLELDLPQLVQAILDPSTVSDEALGKLTSALGTADRQSTADLVQSEPQAAAVALKIVRPLLAVAKKVAEPVAAKEIALPPADAEVAGAAPAKKAKVAF